jgi:hypothetical protein
VWRQKADIKAFPMGDRIKKFRRKISNIDNHSDD